jgi:hypothetical protein
VVPRQEYGTIVPVEWQAAAFQKVLKTMAGGGTFNSVIVAIEMTTSAVFQAVRT